MYLIVTNRCLYLERYYVSVSDNILGGNIEVYLQYESSPSSYSICIWSGPCLYSIVVQSYETDVGSTCYTYYTFILL